MVSSKQTAAARRNRQKLDLYRPRSPVNAPVVIFGYGASWSAAAKSEYRFAGAELAHLGFVAVLADHWLYPQVTFPHSKKTAHGLSPGFSSMRPSSEAIPIALC